MIIMEDDQAVQTKELCGQYKDRLRGNAEYLPMPNLVHKYQTVEGAMEKQGRIGDYWLGLKGRAPYA